MFANAPWGQQGRGLSGIPGGGAGLGMSSANLSLAYATGVTSRAVAMATAALRDRQADVRRVAIAALAAGRDPKHSALLAPLLTDEDSSVRIAAA